MNKKYTIYLNEKLLGTTRFEKADVPMGTVLGSIEFIDAKMAYDFIKKFCINNQVELLRDFPEEKAIATRTLDALKVLNSSGDEIKGIGNQIEGKDGAGFEITIEGISNPFFADEFPNHMSDYENSFNCK